MGDVIDLGLYRKRRDERRKKKLPVPAANRKPPTLGSAQGRNVAGQNMSGQNLTGQSAAGGAQSAKRKGDKSPVPSIPKPPEKTGKDS